MPFKQLFLNENSFDKFQNPYSNNAYHKVCNEYGVDSNTIWLDGDMVL